MTKPKVVLVGTAYPYRGGLASYNERLVREFNRLGYDAEIITFTLQYPNFLFPGKTQYSTSPAPTDLKITRKVNAINPFNWIKVGRQLKKMKPEMVVFKFWLPFIGPSLGTIGRIARKNKFTKIITIVDNIIPHEKRMGDRMLSNYFVKSNHGFVAMSQSVLDDLKTFDESKPKLLSPHPLFDNFGELITKKEACDRLGLDPSFNYILFFGIIRDYKGLDLLIKAFPEIKNKLENVRLIIAGEYYNNEEQYRELIHNLGCEKEVIVHNKFVADEDVKNYFCAADIVAQPYKSATQSGVTQIGYHFEKPMLVTNVGGLAEIIPHNKIGYVVEPDPKEISAHLLEFFQEGKKEVFETNIKEEKKKFMWDKMVASVEKIYKQVK